MANEFKVKNGIKFPDDTIQTTAATSGSSSVTFNNKTSAYTVVVGDLGKIINCTSGTFTVSLTAAATLGSGFNCWIWNTGTGTITVDPNASETIDGRTTLLLRQGEGFQIICNGTNWDTGDKKTMRCYAESATAGSSRPSASGAGSLALGTGTLASGIASSGFGQFATASGQYSFATSLATASADNSTAIGVNSSSLGAQAVTGSGAMALGGSYASGVDSFAAAIADNTSSFGATGANSIALGKTARAAGVSSVAFGELANSSTNYALTFGYDCAASQVAAAALGYRARADIIGKYAYSVGSFGTAGDAQTGTFVARAITLNATPTVLTTNGGAASSINQVVLPNNTAYAFSGLIVARQQASGGTQSAAWEVKGLIRREGSAGTTTLVNSALTVINNAPGWAIALTANTSTGGLAITVTGAASTNIRWVATIQTSEVTYA